MKSFKTNRLGVLAKRKVSSLGERLSFRKKFSFYVLLAVIISSAITSLPIFPAQTSYAAAAGVYADQGLYNNVKAYAYRSALVYCLSNYDDFSPQDVAGGDWFGDDGDVAAVSHLNDKDSGTVECGDNNLVKNAFNAFNSTTSASGGWGGNIQALCGLGYVRAVSGQNCINGTSDLIQPSGWSNDTAFKAIDNKFFGGHASFTDAMYYLLYARSMEIGCRATPSILYDGATPDQKASATGDNSWTMQVVDAKGAINNTIYKSASDFGRGRSITLTQNQNNSGTSSKTCIDLANSANKLAPAYASYIKSHQPGTNGVPGTCEERYNASTPDEIKACQAGFENKGTANYCYTAYHPNGTLENACNYGVQTATGASGATTPQPADDGTTSADHPTCTIQGIGWILCPVMNVMAKIVDGAYAFVSSLLTIQPITTTGTDAGLYSAWGIIRNIANIAFVIAFLIIIFSQLTSVGISNYGIKKMLPRLVVAAILVNVSYWICALAVDLSNIAGASLNGLFKSLGAQLQGPAATAFNTQADGWVGITEFIVAGGVVGAVTLYIGLAALLPALIAALLAIVTVFLVLTLRQALIILLIVLAPLAFVAYLLPNTESLFTKWRQLFQTLLFMFPIIAFIFGASSFASQIVMDTASGDYKIVIQIMGALISVIPLALTPIVMKTAGGLLGKFGGMVNNPNRGPFDRMRKGADKYRDRRQNIMRARRLQGESAFSGARNRIRGDGSSRFRRAAAGVIGAGEGFASGRAVSNLTREQQNTNAEQAAKQAAQDYIVNRVDSEANAGKDDYAQKLAGPTGDVSKVKAAAKAAKLREFNETVAAEKATMSHMGAAELSSIMNDATASHERRAAAAGQIMKVGSDSDIHQVLNTLGTQPKDADGNFADSAISAIQQQVATDLGSRKPVALGSSDVSNLNKGTYDGSFESKIASRLAAGKLSAEKLSQTSTDELDKIMSYVQANSATLKADPATAAALQALQNDIGEFRTNPQLQGRQPAHDIGSRMDNLYNTL